MAKKDDSMIPFEGGWIRLVKEGDTYQSPQGEKVYDYSAVKIMAPGFKYPTEVPKAAMDKFLEALDSSNSDPRYVKFRDIYKSL